MFLKENIHSLTLHVRLHVYVWTGHYQTCNICIDVQVALFLQLTHESWVWSGNFNTNMTLTSPINFGSNRKFKRKQIMFNPNSLDNTKAVVWILLDCYCSVTTLRELGIMMSSVLYSAMLFLTFQRSTPLSCSWSHWLPQL